MQEYKKFNRANLVYNRLLFCNYYRVYDDIYKISVKKVNELLKMEILKIRKQAYDVLGNELEKESAVILMKPMLRKQAISLFREVINEEFKKLGKKDFRKDHYGFLYAKDMINNSKKL